MGAMEIMNFELGTSCKLAPAGGIIQLFIVSLHKVPEFWCSFFFKHKITNFRELLLIIGKSLNSFKKRKEEKREINFKIFRW